MPNITERAHRAKRLRDDEAFQEFIEDVRTDALRQFETSGPKDTEVREEAHAILRVLRKLQGKLDAAVAAETRQARKGQHRGSD